MSSKRRRRIEVLVNSWKHLLPQLVDRVPNSTSDSSSDDAHIQAKSFLLRDAQRRWSVSFSTAREYARSAYLAIARELEEELKRRRSGINLACGIQPHQRKTYARENWEGFLAAIGERVGTYTMAYVQVALALKSSR